MSRLRVLGESKILLVSHGKVRVNRELFLQKLVIFDVISLNILVALVVCLVDGHLLLLLELLSHLIVKRLLLRAT
jgi:hypothetical protein